MARKGCYSKYFLNPIANQFGRELVERVIVFEREAREHWSWQSRRDRVEALPVYVVHETQI